MKLRSFLTALAASVLVLLLIGAGGFFWIASHSPLSLLAGGGQASPAAAMFVPKQSPVMVSLLVNPERLESFRVAIAPPGERRQARSELDQLKQTLLTNTGLNYEQDVEPWLGDEITFAVTDPDFDRDRENGEQPGYMLAIATQDPDRAREFLQVFWQKRAIAGNDLVFEQYAGIKLIYGKAIEAISGSKKSEPSFTDSESLASAVVGDRFVLFANHPKVLRNAINNVQAPGLSLSNSPAYQQALRRLPDRQIGLTFVNLPKLSEWLGESLVGNAASSDQPLLYDSLIAAFELEPGGLLAETALLAAPGKTLTPAKAKLSKPVGALDFISNISPFVAAGSDLNDLWTQLSTGIFSSGAIAELANQPIQSLEHRWGLNLPQDIFSWVTDEYALGLFPRDRAEPDWVFVAEKSADADAAIEHLDAIARQKGYSIGTLELGDQPTSAWTKLSTTQTKRNKGSIALSAEVQGIHTTVGPYEIFATSAEALNQALQASENALRESSDFRQAIAPLADPNNGYLYMDWPSVREPLRQQFPIVKLAEVVGQSFFNHVRSLTVTSYGNDANLQRGAVFIRLK